MRLMVLTNVCTWSPQWLNTGAGFKTWVVSSLCHRQQPIIQPVRLYFGFNVPPKGKVIWKRDIGFSREVYIYLVYHLRSSIMIKPATSGLQASDLATATWKIPVPVKLR